MALMDFSLGDIGDLFRGIRESITGEKIQDPETVLKNIARLEKAFLETKGKIIEAEAKSEHWLVSSWRPITMLVFVFIIANNYIIVPYAQALFSTKIPALELTQEMWDLVQLGLGGYVVGRSFEKAMKNYSAKDN